jgi:hypothetical protein
MDWHLIAADPTNAIAAGLGLLERITEAVEGGNAVVPTSLGISTPALKAIMLEKQLASALKVQEACALIARRVRDSPVECIDPPESEVIRQRIEAIDLRSLLDADDARTA